MYTLRGKTRVLTKSSLRTHYYFYNGLHYLYGTNGNPELSEKKGFKRPKNVEIQYVLNTNLERISLK